MDNKEVIEKIETIIKDIINSISKVQQTYSITILKEMYKIDFQSCV